VKTIDDALNIFNGYAKFCALRNIDPWIKASATSYKTEVLLRQNNGKLHYSVTTINKYIRRLASLFTYAVNQGTTEKNIWTGMTLPKPRRKASDEAHPYTYAEVETILAHLDPRADARHWIVLLAMYAGARANELASLYLKDIRTVDGIVVLDINVSTPDKKVKNAHSQRLVPLHHELLRRGFLAHVEALRVAGETRLFPMWPHHVKNGYQQYSGRWYREWRRSIGIHDKDFHSWRHTFETGLRDQRVNESEAQELAGHKPGDSMSFGRYAKPGHLANLKESIDKLPINPGRP
jgi:integrase